MAAVAAGTDSVGIGRGGADPGEAGPVVGRGRGREGVYSLMYCARLCGVGRLIAVDLVDLGYLGAAASRVADREPRYREGDMRAAHLEWKANEPTEDFCFRCLEWKPIEDVKDGACSRCRTPKRRARTLAEAEGR
jgi:hypothetical protein